MAKFAILTQEIKPYALNRRISDEDFLNAFLCPYILAGKIKDKFGHEYYLNKTRTSDLLNCKEDVPKALREALGQYGIKERTADEMDGFVADYLNPAMLPRLDEALLKLIQEDSSISESYKVAFSNQPKSTAELLAELLINSLSECNIEIKGGRFLWKNGSNAVEIIEDDLFRYGFDNRKKTRKNIVVIPVNTAFDTHVTRKFEGESTPVVSDMTIHGQWLSRMEQSGENLTDLDKRISDSLACLGYTSVSVGKSASGKCEVYGIGSVAVIETKNAVYFLLAISEFDEVNNAQSTPENIKLAVNSLLQVYDRIGQGYDLYMPVIGTGRSRTGMLFGEAYELLVSALIDNRAQIQGHIYIVVKPENMSEIKEGEHDISH